MLWVAHGMEPLCPTNCPGGAGSPSPWLCLSRTTLRVASGSCDQHGHIPSGRPHYWGLVLCSPVLEFLRILSVGLYLVSEVNRRLGGWLTWVFSGWVLASPQLVVLCPLACWALFPHLPHHCCCPCLGWRPGGTLISPSPFDLSGVWSRTWGGLGPGAQLGCVSRQKR